MQKYLGQSAFKVPTGKLVRARVEHDGENLSSVRFTGDFFLYPEHAIAGLEASLKDVPLFEGPVGYAERLGKWLSQEKAQLVGAQPEDLARVVDEAIKSAKEH